MVTQKKCHMKNKPNVGLFYSPMVIGAECVHKVTKLNRIQHQASDGIMKRENKRVNYLIFQSSRWSGVEV